MEAKELRNLIIALLILVAGIRLLSVIGSGYIAQFQGTLNVDESLVRSVESIGTILMLGIGVIVLLLIPYWLHKRSQEKKAKQQPKPQQQPQRSPPPRQQPRPQYPQYPYRR